jgi:hypothetical protein
MMYIAVGCAADSMESSTDPVSTQRMSLETEEKRMRILGNLALKVHIQLPVSVWQQPLIQTTITQFTVTTVFAEHPHSNQPPSILVVRIRLSDEFTSHSHSFGDGITPVNCSVMNVLS